jgi:hypothetical protein
MRDFLGIHLSFRIDHLTSFDGRVLEQYATPTLVMGYQLGENEISSDGGSQRLERPDYL